MKSVKRVFLYAYDKVNLGDDLFIRTITSRYPGTKFYLWSDAINKHNFADIRNLILVDQDSVSIRMLSKIWPSFPSRYHAWIENHCDAVVYIGGSIFIEYPHWERYVTWWNEKATQHMMYVLGANWGPHTTEAYRAGLAEAFSTMQDVCFRDRYSCEQFEGVSTVRYAPDMLLDYPMPCCAIKQKQIFVSLIHCGGDDHSSLSPYKNTYLGNMVTLLQKYLDDGCSIVLASFCKHEGDEQAVLDILQRLNGSSDRLRTLKYNGTNSKDLLEAIAESDYVIATRFHGVILALAAGRPVLPVIYSDKTLHTLESIGFHGRVFDFRLSEPMQYEQSKENWEHDRGVQIEQLRLKSQKHFAKLDLMLK